MIGKCFVSLRLRFTPTPNGAFGRLGKVSSPCDKSVKGVMAKCRKVRVEQLPHLRSSDANFSGELPFAVSPNGSLEKFRLKEVRPLCCSRFRLRRPNRSILPYSSLNGLDAVLPGTQTGR